MRILITNDDGIAAPGLATLTQIATELAGPDGEVWTVAPAFEQSGVGHCINYVKPSMLSELAPRRVAVEGSPADCVLAGLRHVVPGPVDVVLSGVNRGNNAAENTMYSGTIGACIEAALQGAKSIALSQFYGPANVHLDDPFESAAAHGAGVIRTLLDKADWGGETYQMFYNVNFPPVPAADTKGPKAVAQGYRGHGRFGVTHQKAPSGRDYLWINGSKQDDPTAPGTDVAANLDGYISVTPMRCDLTDHAALPALQAAFE